MMNNAGKGEYLWMQIIIKARKNDEWYGIIEKKGGKPTDVFIEKADEYIKKIMTNAANRAKTVLEESDVVEGKMNALLTDGEKKEIKGAGGRGMVRWDYPWEDFRGIRKAIMKRNLFFFYKHRAYFFVPYDQAPVFLTPE